MISSTLKIISAASVAERMTWSFDLKASRMPSVIMSPTFPSVMFRPMVLLPCSWAARSCVTSSELSSPPLSAMMAGIFLRARAYASMARAFLPATPGTALSTARAMAASMHPPPHTTRVSRTAAVSTARASCRLRSASSRMWSELPRRMIEQASPDLHSPNLIRRSSPIITSSISPHVPRVTRSGWSKVEAISAPRTAARRSMPSKSACSMAITPASANICSGKL
mmetsp:Transcript_1993/g.2880  ORF Transcript_1993/g.2880 Transcript_1993/m.2880 type:complete len:225 (+) Transcript_1993:163-837(+)